MSFANKNSTISSFTNCTSFISFFCLPEVVGILSAMLHKNGESKHTYPVPDFRTKVFSLLPLCMSLAVGFLHSLY